MEVKNKPRAVVSYEKLATDIQEQIKLEYPRGYSKHLIPFTDRDGSKIKGLRFETEEKIYLIRMTVPQAQQIIKNDDDYNDDGILKASIREEYEDKYSDEDEPEAIEALVGEDFEDDFIDEDATGFEDFDEEAEEED